MMNKKRLFLYIPLFLALMLGSTGCSSDESSVEIVEKDDSNDNPTLYYSIWRCYGFGNILNSEITIIQPADNDCYNLVFYPDFHLTGTSSSNELYGEYQIENRDISIVGLGGTKIGEINDGYDYVDALRDVEYYEMDNHQLKLFYNRGQNFLIYYRI